MKIITNRLVIRDYMESDLYNLYFTLSSEEVCRYLTYRPFKHIEEAERELKSRLKRIEYLAITLKDSTYIGELYIKKENSGSYEIKFFLSNNFWHQGYALEALQSLTDYYIENKGAFKFIAYVIKENTSACKLLDRCSFTMKNEKDGYYTYEL